MKSAVSVTASARKSLGEYKPLLVYPNGKTEVCEQSAERFDRNTKKGMVNGNRMARGNTYASRQDAIEAAQKVIDTRRVDAETMYEKFMKNNKVDGAKRKREEAILWGSKNV